MPQNPKNEPATPTFKGEGSKDSPHNKLPGDTDQTATHITSIPTIPPVSRHSRGLSRTAFRKHCCIRAFSVTLPSHAKIDQISTVSAICGYFPHIQGPLLCQLYSAVTKECKKFPSYTLKCAVEGNTLTPTGKNGLLKCRKHTHCLLQGDSYTCFPLLI